MSNNRDEAPDTFTEQLIDYDESLARGLPPDPVADTPKDLDTNLAQRLAKARHCLQMIERVRNGVSPSTAGSSDWSQIPDVENCISETATCGRFEIIRELGRGGHGVVFLARDPELDRLVALKLPRPEVMLSADLKNRFLREGKAVAGLSHAHIVPVFEVGHVGSLCYMASAYCEGLSLAEWLAQQRQPVPIEAAARLVQTLAEAVQHAHGRGIVHRDLKPNNILLQAEILDPMITDFGLAKMSSGDGEATRAGAVLGTPAYMAPEQAAGRVDVGPAADLYALGAILYELLTGRPPFRKESDLATLRAVETEEPIAPRRLRRDTPRDLEAICLKCLEKSPSRRYSSATALAADLGRFLNSEPVNAHRIGGACRLGRWCRRNPLVAALTGLVFALLLLVAIGSPLVAWHVGEQRDAALLAEQAALAAQAGEHKALVTAEHRLYESLLAQARALRASDLAGRRFDSLAAITEAAELARRLDLGPEATLELRNETIACLAMTDFRLERCWQIPTGWPQPGANYTRVDFDKSLGRYACADPKGNISVRRSDNGAELFRLQGFDAQVTRIRFCPSGEFLAALYRKGNSFQAWLWKLPDSCPLAPDSCPLTPVLKIPDTAWGTEFAFSDDSGLLAMGTRDGAVAIFDLAEVREWKRLPADLAQHRLCFQPGGRWLAVAGPSSKEVRILDVDSEAVVGRLQHPRGLWALAWNPNGKGLATGCDDRSIYLWPTTDSDVPKPTVLKGHRGPVVVLAYSRGSDLLASFGWDATLRLWHPESGCQLAHLPGLYPAGRLQFGSHDRHLPVTTSDSQLGIVAVVQGTVCRRLEGGHGHSVSDLNFSPDGRLLASAGGAGPAGGVRLWDVIHGKQLAHRPITCTAALFCPDGHWLFTSSGGEGVHRWSVKSPLSKESPLGPPHQFHTGAGHYEFLSVSRNKLAVALRGSHRVLILDLDDPGRKHILGKHEQVRHLAFCPAGCWLATGTWHGTGVKIWDIESGTVHQELGTIPNTNVAFSPDGRWLVTGGEGHGSRQEYCLWDTATWRCVHRIPSAVTRKPMGDMAFSGDGKLLALAHSSQAVQLIEPASGRALALLVPGQPIGLTTVSLSPDGAYLAAGSNTGEIYLWDLQAMRQHLRQIGLDWND